MEEGGQILLSVLLVLVFLYTICKKTSSYPLRWYLDRLSEIKYTEVDLEPLDSTSTNSNIEKNVKSHSGLPQDLLMALRW